MSDRELRTIEEYAETAKLRRAYSDMRVQPQPGKRERRPLLANLKVRYGGIDASESSAEPKREGARFRRLMREWRPEYWARSDDRRVFKSIVGKPTRVELVSFPGQPRPTEVLHYTFDEGESSRVGIAHRFGSAA